MKEKVPLYDKLVLPYHKLRASVAAVRYGFPGKKMTVIGVTGTNGKTTTSFMIWKMLNEAGHKTGLMTTVGWGVDKIHEQHEHMTTVNAESLNRRMREIANMGAKYLVLEMTSHGLAQYRATGVPINIAVITNLTHEHLDYHKTFERYLRAKLKLFILARKNKRGRQIGVINADNDHAGRYVFETKKPLTYGIKGGHLQARQVKLGNDGVEYFVKYEGERLHIRTRIPGEFNVYNSMAAVCVGLSLGLEPRQIEDGIYALESVEGRMARIDEGQDFAVVMDYAHTPDAFLKLLPGMKEATKGRLIAVFGSAGGRRDPAKRPIQGEIAGKYADILVLTEEDDRDTPGMEILNQIAEGAEKSGKVRDKDMFFELNRPKAISMAAKMAKKGDTVLYLGKGNEKTIERADGEHEYYEETEIRKALRGLKKQKSTRKGNR
jgi:UDP-N-acetylmuramoyl-L-alanyl-D-glutamate--2,6-diaminopimelate ligase